MAPVRCRNFNPDGTVRKPCRYGTACNWIHPDNPQWDSARNYNPDEVRHHDSRGSWSAQKQKSAASVGKAVDHGWGIPQKQVQGQTDKSSWGSSTGSVNQSVSLRTAASAFTDNVWGPSSSKVTGENRDNQTGWGSTHHGWGTDADDGKGGKGKGIVSKDGASGWGASASTSGGWETPGSATTDKGWGSNSDRASKDKTDKATTTLKGWGASTTESSTNETNADQGWLTSTSDWDMRAKPPDPRRPRLPTPLPTDTRKGRSRSPTPQSAMSPMAAPPSRKLRLPGQNLSSSTSALHSVQLVTDKGTPDLVTSLKIKTKGIDLAESVLPNSARPHEMTRSRIQSNTIRYTLQAVRLQSELDDAMADVERWKRLRSSAQFTRATPSTQNIIKDQRSAYGRDVKELETQLHATIRYLADLPELTTHADLVSAEAEEQDLVEYVAQLRDWTAGLRTLYRASPPPETESSTSQATTARPEHPNEILWNRMETLVQLVDDSISFIEDALYAKRDIQVDVASRATVLRNDHDAKQQSEAKDKAEKLLKETKQIGSDFEVLVAETAELLTVMHENGLILDNLKTELVDCETVNQQFSGYIQQLERWKEEDTAQIEQLTQQIKNLHTKKRPTRVPFDQEELKEQIKRSTLKKMTEQVHNLFHTIQGVAQSSNQNSASEILKQLDPILEVTNEICRRAEALTSRLSIPQASESVIAAT